MGSTRSKADLIDQHDKIRERIRKMEVMGLSRTLTPKKWVPNRDDLYAIAGHVTMMGIWPQAGSHYGWNSDLHGQPRPPGEHTFQLAHTGQASQMLWALLDQRGFTSPAEAQDWTAFLYEMTALPHPSQYVPIIMSKDTPDPDVLAEMRPAMQIGPWMRRGFSGTTDAGQSTARSIALYWTGIPAKGEWYWHDQTSAAQDPTSWWAFDEADNPMYWPDFGHIALPYRRYSDDPDFPRDAIPPGTLYGDFYPGVGATSSLGDPIVYANNAVTPDFPCGPPEGAAYNGYTFPGIPVGPYNAGGFPCPNAPLVLHVIGAIWRYKMMLPATDMYLAVPPRQQSVNIVSSDISGAYFQTDPGMQWLTEAAENNLPFHPFVSQFYQDHLPIAYAKAYQSPRKHWQQLELSYTWRGRIEAQRYRDRVILRGQAHWGGNSEHIYNDAIFHWPREWPDPGTGITAGNRYVVVDDEGNLVPVLLSSYEMTIQSNWAQENNYHGPHTLRFDGTVIPMPVNVGSFP